MKTDTIAAIATAMSNSGIGVIRISGENAVETGDKVFQTPGGKHILNTVESHTIHYGFIVDECNENNNGDAKKIDEVLVSVMRAPRSFTAEDTVEISCHGGILILQKILELVCRNGARLAEPGEFTKRAFLNGRIDLSEAEAVMDVISSQNEYALKSSMNQLQGKLAEQIRDLRESLIYEIAFIESALDDPEHISLDGYPEQLSEKLNEITEKIRGLIATFLNGKLIKNGISTVIVGKPNAGKSSLLNLLVGEERAIVTDIAGTTRDALQESVNLHGIHLNLIDTAGIRNTEDTVEKIGVERAKKYAEGADLILYVVDTSKKLDDSDREIIRFLRNFWEDDTETDYGNKLDKNELGRNKLERNEFDRNLKKTIILLNKNDLEQIVSEEDIQKEFENQSVSCDTFKRNIVIVKASTKDGTGMDHLESVVKDLFLSGMIQNNDEVMITNLRHKEALQQAYDSLELVKKSIENGMPEDFYSIDLMDSYKALGLIIGEEVEDDLVEEIFSKFCMGK